MITGLVRTLLACACLGSALMSGCATSPQASFYTLEALVPPAAATTQGRPPRLAVAGVTLPELVDRPQLVVRGDGSRVFVLEMHRWAEPLKSAIPRILAENLARLLGVEQVAAYPQNAALAAEDRLFVDFQSIETRDDSVLLDAFWSIRSTADTPARSGRAVLQEPVSARGHDAQAAAFSRALAAVSREIAKTISKGP